MNDKTMNIFFKLQFILPKFEGNEIFFFEFVNCKAIKCCNVYDLFDWQ